MRVAGKGALMFGDGTGAWPRPTSGPLITVGAAAGSSTVAVADIGNVLGTPAFPKPPAGAYTTEAKGYSNTLGLIFQLGYPNMGNTGYGGGSDGPTIGPSIGTSTGATPTPDYRNEPASLGAAQTFDYNVKATLLRHGNFDYANQAIIWDPAIASRVLPPSLFRSVKPPWFGNLVWPPIDPTNPGRCAVVGIPAGYRSVHGADPPAAAAR